MLRRDRDFDRYFTLSATDAPANLHSYIVRKAPSLKPENRYSREYGDPKL
jgi:hypothetical protein